MKISEGRCKALRLEEPCALWYKLGTSKRWVRGIIASLSLQALLLVVQPGVLLSFPATTAHCWLLLSILGCGVFGLHSKLCCFSICEFSFKQFLSNQVILLCITAYSLETHFAHMNKQYKTSAFPEEFIIKYKLNLHIISSYNNNSVCTHPPAKTK